MNTTAPDPRLDRLYDLLPAIYRMRDADQGYPLQALLRVIAEQVNGVEDDIEQLYENWFIETADDWVVPYLGDLIGYRPVSDAGLASDDTATEGRELNRVLVPRREVANTIRYRRRKGSLALLELLANDVAGWPARAVEYFKLLGWTQNLNHLHLERARTADLRRMEELDLIGGPFDSLARTVDVRHINSRHTPGRHNIPSVGVFVWRLRPYSITRAPARCREEIGENCYTFNTLGLDTPLYTNPITEADPTHIANELNVPIPIRPRAFVRQILKDGRLDHTEASPDYYGAGKSLAIWAPGWAGCDDQSPVPATKIIPADLADWGFNPPSGFIGVDPVLGRFCFPLHEKERPPGSVRVSYNYAFAADMGGGEYLRDVFDPSSHDGKEPEEPQIIRIDPGAPPHALLQALQKWQNQMKEKKTAEDTVIELNDSGVYFGPGQISIPTGHTLQIRAANGVRPVIRLPDRSWDQADAFSVEMSEASRLTLDGLVITGRPVHLHGPVRGLESDRQPVAKTQSPASAVRPSGKEQPPATANIGTGIAHIPPARSRTPICGSSIVIRHCTLVPAWTAVPNWVAQEKEPGAQHRVPPSLELHDIRARVRIEHSILGAIQVHENEVRLDPIPICITDSILDATAPHKVALGTPDGRPAHVVLTIRRCTVFGIVEVHAVELAENSIFTNCLNVARRQLGCMRFCHVPYGCRTPRRYHCQPELAAQLREEQMKRETELPNSYKFSTDEIEAAKANERERVIPQFNSTRYGTPTYAQLSDGCAEEIRRGADDESEMGAFHDLFQPQREANLRTRLDEYTPAGMDVGIIHAT